MMALTQARDGKYWLIGSSFTMLETSDMGEEKSRGIDSATFKGMLS
jgi:hypothetical protein